MEKCSTLDTKIHSQRAPKRLPMMLMRVWDSIIMLKLIMWRPHRNNLDGMECLDSRTLNLKNDKIDQTIPLT